MNPTLMAALLSSGLLWPFGNKDNDQKTLQSLEHKDVVLPPDQPVQDPSEKARENYEWYLQQQGGDDKLKALTMHRLGDVEVMKGEKELEDGLSPDQIHAYDDAIERYRKLLASYPDYPQGDMVLYQISRSQEMLGREVEARKTLDELMEHYPNTAIKDEVQFRRGELLFSENKYREADSAYAAVVSFGPTSEFYTEALYKRAWAEYKLGDYENTLDSVFTLLDGQLGDVPADQVENVIASYTRPQRELLDDSLRVVALSMSQMPEENALATESLAHGNPAYAYLLYRGLADLYMAQERYIDASNVLKSFAKADPMHPSAPKLYMESIKPLEQGNFPTEILATKEEFADKFGLDQPFWQGKDPANYPDVTAYLEDTIWALAQYHHAQAQLPKQTKATEEYRAAAGRYQQYLAYFPTSEKAPQASYLLGDTRYAAGDLPGAVAAYENAAYSYPGYEKAADAAYAGLVARQNYEKQLQGEDQKLWNRDRLAANIKFAQNFPTDPRAVAAKADAADGLFAIGENALAASVAQTVVDDDRSSPKQKRVALNIIGIVSFDAKQYEQSEKAYLQIREIDRQTGAKPDPAIEERIAASIYKQGEVAREQGDNAKAAEIFMRVGQVTPNADIRETAEYDASKAYLAAGEQDKAIPIMESFRTRFPNSKLNEDMTASLALAYSNSGQSDKAAAEFERIAAAPDASADVKKQALLQAADEYEKAKMPKESARVLTSFLDQKLGDFNDNVEALNKLIGYAGETGSTTQKAKLEKELVAMDAGAGAQRTDRSKYLAAHASLDLVAPLQKSFDTQKLGEPFAKTLKEKDKRMKEAFAAYAKVLDYGVADVQTEATYKSAELFTGMADAIMNSEKPKNLDADAMEQYEVQLEELAYGYEEKAMEVHAANAARAKEGNYDEWVRKSFEKLAELNPGRYKRPAKSEDYVDSPL